MTNDQLNDLSMFDTVDMHFEEHWAAIDRIPRFARAVKSFRTKTAQIRRTAGVQKSVAEGKTDHKLRAQEAFTIAVNLVRSILLALALDIGNAELQKKMNMPEYKFRSLRDSEQLDYAKIVLAETEQYKKELEESGISQEILDDLGKQIETCAKAISKRDHSQVQKTNSTGDLDQLFSETRAFLRNTLDNHIELFRLSDPQMYNEYWIARQIRRLGIRHEKPEPAPEPAPPAAVEQQ
jgi:hypothetical protein